MAEIVIIEDNRGMREGLELLLRRKGHRTRVAANGQRGIELLEEREADLVITDMKMARLDGIGVLKRVKDRHPHVEVMMISAHGSIKKVVEAMQLGAADFIEKPFAPEEFAVKVERLVRDAAERRRLLRENQRLRVENQELRSGDFRRYGEIVGDSDGMLEVFRWIERVGPTNSTITIYGESGTGKELVARAVHAASNRRDGAFVAVHCGALAESLLESELFGHEKGAFTGADKRRRGRFELAHKGTLFLDEIGTLPEQTQIRLLRVLQEKEVERVGGETPVKVDVRIIAATNIPPDELLEGPFRNDLFYRLHVITTFLPPLRERIVDIPLLVDHFIEKFGNSVRTSVRTVSKDTLRLFASYDWPGNVRELENVIQTALVLADGEELTPEDIPNFGTGVAPAPESDSFARVKALVRGGSAIELKETLEDFEREIILRALEHSDGVKAKAARLLGLKGTALHYKIEKYGLE